MKIPTLEEVLDAFSVEPHHGKAELEQYIQQYPQYAIELVDLSRRLLRPVKLNLSPLSAEELKRVDAAWVAHAPSGPSVGHPSGAGQSGPVAVASILGRAIQHEIVNLIAAGALFVLNDSGGKDSQAMARSLKTLLEMVENRYATRPEVPCWPSASTRQCTSDLKRGPIEREIGQAPEVLIINGPNRGHS